MKPKLGSDAIVYRETWRGSFLINLGKGLERHPLPPVTGVKLGARYNAPLVAGRGIVTVAFVRVKGGWKYDAS